MPHPDGRAQVSKKEILMVFLILLALSSSSFGQSRPDLMPEVGGANLPAQRLGGNDLIAVSIYGAPEFSRTVRVGPDGYIAMPLLKGRIKVAGLVPAEVETAITEALQRDQILVDPVVTVTVAEYHSRPISVVGAVRKRSRFKRRVR